MAGTMPRREQSGKRVKYTSCVTALVIALCLSLAGCGSSGHGDAQDRTKQGVTETEVRVGTSLSLSGHAGSFGRRMLRGVQCYLQHINAQGGVHGRAIRLVPYDDQYSPALCVSNTQKLIISDEVFCLFSYMGTATTVKVIPLVQEARIPFVAMLTGANLLREPFHPYIINVRPSYYQETEEIVRRLVDELDVTKVAVLYQYDAYGFDGLKGTEFALREHGLRPVARGTYARGTLKVRDAVDRIAASGAEAVVMVGTAEPCARFIELCRERDFTPMFHALSFVGAEALSRYLDGKTQGVFASLVVPPPSAPGAQQRFAAVQEYVQLLKQYAPEAEPDSVGLEGFINAKVLVEALQRAGRELDRPAFIKAVQSIRAKDIGIGTPLSYSIVDHQGLDHVFMTRFVDGHPAIITDWDRLREQLRRTESTQ